MGPLDGIKIIELAGIGPGPMGAMALADLGATVLRIERTQPTALGIERPRAYDLLLRNRQIIALDLKSSAARELVFRLLEDADGLIEGFRPGVAERMGFSPQACLERNPRLVYGRMTGWGQEGPLSQAAGHDLNYIAVTGVLDAIGRADQPPTPPLNLIGDYGGGGLYLALGMLAGILHARQSGQGQIIDAAIVDGTAALAASLVGMHGAGMIGPRGHNLLDSGSPYYDVYECADGRWVSIAPLEEKFRRDLFERLGLPTEDARADADPAAQRAMRERLAAVIRTRPQSAWCDLLSGTDACFAPVLSLEEAPTHPHLQARQTYITVDGVVQPAPAPRFSRTPAGTPRAPQAPSPESSRTALTAWLGDDEAAQWLDRLTQATP